MCSRTCLLIVLTVSAVSTTGPALAQTSLTIPNHMMPSDGGRFAELGRLDPSLKLLHDRHVAGEPVDPGSLHLRGTTVLVTVTTEDPLRTETELSALGMSEISAQAHALCGWLPIESLEDAAALPGVRGVRPVLSATDAQGAVSNQGERALWADFAKKFFAVDGSGVTIGIISNSYDCDGNAEDDVRAGELPPDIRVIAEVSDCALVQPGALDEGRAMAQLIHDIAPGARLLFASGFPDLVTNMVPAIDALVASGADIIVDDLSSAGLPFFQDGLVTAAVDRAHEAGVAYFTSAGNRARDSYESPFEDSGQFGFEGPLHDFDPGPGVDVINDIFVPVGQTLELVFQWSQPFFSVSGEPGSSSNLSVLFTDAMGRLLAPVFRETRGGDPILVFRFENAGDIDTNGDGLADEEFGLALEFFGGPTPERIKYTIEVGSPLHLEWNTFSGTSTGHKLARGGFSVGAARYDQTPRFGVRPPVLEPFSSAAGTPRLFDVLGQPIFEIREKPDAVGSRRRQHQLLRSSRRGRPGRRRRAEFLRDVRRCAEHRGRRGTHARGEPPPPTRPGVRDPASRELRHGRPIDRRLRHGLRLRDRLRLRQRAARGRLRPRLRLLRFWSVRTSPKAALGSPNPQALGGSQRRSLERSAPSKRDRVLASQSEALALEGEAASHELLAFGTLARLERRRPSKRYPSASTGATPQPSG